MQGFNRTPWNATSRTTAQDALWQHISNRNTSSQPFITSCARQVMNRSKQDPRKRNAPMSRVLRAAPLILNERSNILTSTETDEQQGRPFRPNPPSTQKSEPLREKGEPLTCSPYKQSGGSSGFYQSINQSEKIFNVSRITNVIARSTET